MNEDYEESDDEREFRHRHGENRFFVDSLAEDVRRCEELFRANDDHFARRTLVRTLFAQVEGLSASVIDWAGYYAAEESALKGQYSEPERLALRGHAVAINAKGDAELVPATYRSTKQTIRFALILAGRGAAVRPEIDYADGGWAALCQGLDVRNRLMHPKMATDLIVADEELDLARRGCAWLLAAHETLEQALQRTIAGRISKRFAHFLAGSGTAPDENVPPASGDGSR